MPTLPSLGVAEYYANKTIFITGASGFIGKVLVEKLIRCCPEIKTIYLLMREKYGYSPQQRLDSFIDAKCFEKIKDPNLFSKLLLISGNILEEGLGISDQDRSILQNEVQIVFHSAAMVRFDMSLRDAVNSNLLGSKRVLDLAEGMKKLEVFLDISTAFCHDEFETLEEKLLPAIHRPQDVINSVKWMNDDLLDKIQPELIKPFCNTYGYTKNLTEELLSQYKEKFTIALARPSIVLPALKEPLPGWVDNLNGPTGLLYASAKGILHTSYSKNSLMDIIPVDIAVNGCILLAYTTAIECTKDVKVCNINSYGSNRISWWQSIEPMKNYILEYPVSGSLYYPAGSTCQYRLINKFLTFFYHILPAYFIDFLLILFRQKTFMVGLERRIRKGQTMYEYYTCRYWEFKTDVFQSLKNYITEEENKVFYTDMMKFDYESYMKIYYLGMREFLAKEDLSTLPEARLHMKRLYYLHITLKTMFYILLAYLAYSYLYRFFNIVKIFQ